MKRTPRRNRSGLGAVLGVMFALLPFLTAGAPRPAPPPLPELNAKVLAFARAKLGDTVGDGSCSTLAIAALKEAGARAFPSVEPGGNLIWGQPIDSFREALPGDILQFHQAVFRGKRTIGIRGWATWHYEFPHHTAIVTRVSERGKLVSILHQNVTVAGQKDSGSKNVQEGTLRMDSLQPGGWVRIYRPVARNASPPASNRDAEMPVEAAEDEASLQP